MAETPKNTDPTRFSVTIHQERSPNRRRPVLWQTSAQAR